jgi:hypothetical protein
MLVSKPNPFPGIFLEVPHRNVKLNWSDKVNLFETYFVEIAGHRNNVLSAHPGSPKTLMAVPQCCVNNLDFTATVRGPTAQTHNRGDCFFVCRRHASNSWF